MLISLLINIRDTSFSLPRFLIIFILMIKQLELHIRFLKLSLIILSAIAGIVIIHIITPIHLNILTGSQVIILYLTILLVTVLLILEIRTDKIKRYSYQFVFWSILFIGAFAFSVYQINEYLKKFDDNSMVAIFISILGIIFNFAQVLSAGRNMFEESYKVVLNEYNLLIQNNLYKFDDFIILVLNFSVKQKLFRQEVREQIKELGLKKFLIKLIPIISIQAVLIFITFKYTDTIVYKIDSIFDFLIQKIGNLWSYLWNGNEEIAILVAFLIIFIIGFYKNLLLLFSSLKNKNLEEFFSLLSPLLIFFILIYFLIAFIFKLQSLLKFAYIPVVLSSIVFIMEYLIKLLKSK
jgi:hypothetical protein